jgi:hypothetical protein
MLNSIALISVVTTQIKYYFDKSSVLADLFGFGIF